MDDRHVDETFEPDESSSADDLRVVENDLLSTMLQAAKQREHDTEVIRIVRDDEPVFYFRVRGITEKEDGAARKQAQIFGKSNKRLAGMRLPDDFDASKYRSLLIITATTAFCDPTRFDDVPITDDSGNVVGTKNIAVAFRDVASLWESSELRKQLNLVDQSDVIDAVLKPGEKANVIDVIDRLSGHGQALEDDLGN